MGARRCCARARLRDEVGRREILRRELSGALAADDILVVHHIVTALASTRDDEVHALLTRRLALTPAGEHERLAFYRRVAARMQAGADRTGDGAS